MLEVNKIYLGDCLDIMKQIPEESIDLFLTDPPYKIIAGGMSLKDDKKQCGGILSKRYVSDGTNCSNKWIKKNEYNVPACVKQGKMFEYNDIKFSQWMPDAFRVLKNGSHCYIMTNDRNMQELLNEATKIGFKLLNILVWSKNNATPNKYYMKSAEFILLFRKGFAKSINDMGTKTVLNINNIIGNKTHPSEKPVNLFKILIENSTMENQLVLDPFSGSGVTAVACKELKRNFILIEIDKEYNRISKNRVEQKQLTLFDF